MTSAYEAGSMPCTKLSLTKTAVDAIQSAGFYRDDKLAGFLIKATWIADERAQGGRRLRKVYQVNGKLKGTRRNATVQIGEHGAPVFDEIGDKVSSWTADKARAKAIEIKSQFLKGENPNEILKAKTRVAEEKRIKEKAREAEQALTLEAVYNSYCAGRELRPKSLVNYNFVINVSLADWKTKRLASITSRELTDKYQELAEYSESIANNAFRLLKALFKYACRLTTSDNEPLITVDPFRFFDGIKKLEPRTRHLYKEEVAAWYEACLKHSNPVRRDVLLLALFTGMRREEVQRLRWNEIDFRAGLIKLPAPRAKNKKAVEIPMSSYVKPLLLRRWNGHESNEFVFPGAGGDRPTNSIFIAVNNIQEATKGVDVAGLRITPHDLRRTFISFANDLHISQTTIKALVNHSKKGDVTEAYIQVSMEARREATQRVTDRILSYCAQVEPTLTLETETGT